MIERVDITIFELRNVQAVTLVLYTKREAYCCENKYSREIFVIRVEGGHEDEGTRNNKR